MHNVESICISIQSMLAGNTKAESEYTLCALCCGEVGGWYVGANGVVGPPGDAEFVRSNRQRPRDINFLYHDKTV